MTRKKVDVKAEVFTSKGHQAIIVEQDRDGSLIVYGATVGPASNNALRLWPQPKPNEDE